MINLRVPSVDHSIHRVRLTSPASIRSATYLAMHNHESSSEVSTMCAIATRFGKAWLPIRGQSSQAECESDNSRHYLITGGTVKYNKSLLIQSLLHIVDVRLMCERERAKAALTLGRHNGGLALEPKLWRGPWATPALGRHR
jgi:hypothetical protein